MDEQIMEVGPIPRFKHIGREHRKAGSIWVVKSLRGVYVSRSAPAIARALKLKGFDMWPSSVYRSHGRLATSVRCKGAAEVNAALEGVSWATFVVVIPDAWVCEDEEQEDAAIVSGDDGD